MGVVRINRVYPTWSEDTLEQVFVLSDGRKMTAGEIFRRNCASNVTTDYDGMNEDELRSEMWRWVEGWRMDDPWNPADENLVVEACVQYILASRT